MNNIEDIFKRYEGIKAPDKKEDVIYQTDSVKIIRDSFLVWRAYANQLLSKNDLHDCSLRTSLLLEEAYRILEQYDEILPKVLDNEMYFFPLMYATGKFKQWKHLFYTALLNMGKKERTLVIPAFDLDGADVGHYLIKGVIDTSAESTRMCYYSRNTCIINRGSLCACGWGTEDSVFINYGKCNTYMESKNCLFIDYTYPHSRNDSNGLFITAGAITAPHISLYADDISNDFLLNSMVKEMKEITYEIGKAQPAAIRTLADNIKQHYKQHYGNR